MRPGRVAATAALVLACGAAGWWTVRHFARSGAPPALPAVDDTAIAERLAARTDAVRAAPRDAEAWAQLAMTYHVHELLAEAVACYERSLALDGTQTRRRWFLALALEASGRSEDALREAHRVFAEEPGYAPARAVVARWLLVRGQLDAALEHAREAVRAAPEDAAIRVVLADVLLAKGDAVGAESEARAALRRPFERAAQQAYAHQVLGRALQERGASDEAKVELARGRGADQRQAVPDPWTEEVGSFQAGFRLLTYAAHDALEAGRPGSALPLLFELQRRSPGHLQVVLDLSRALREVGRASEAYDAVSEGLNARPEEGALHAEGALVAHALGDDALALRHADDAVRFTGNGGAALETRGTLHLRAGRWAAAAADFEAAFRADPTRATALVAAGVARLELGEADAAADAFRRCLEADPSVADAHAGLAIASVLRADLAAAREHLARSRALDAGPTRLQQSAQRELDAAAAGGK